MVAGSRAIFIVHQHTLIDFLCKNHAALPMEKEDIDILISKKQMEFKLGNEQKSVSDCSVFQVL